RHQNRRSRPRTAQPGRTRTQRDLLRKIDPRREYSTRFRAEIFASIAEARCAVGPARRVLTRALGAGTRLAFQEGVSPGGHLVTTVAACTTADAITGGGVLAASIAAGGFLIDVDHAVDYVV